MKVIYRCNDGSVKLDDLVTFTQIIFSSKAPIYSYRVVNDNSIVTSHDNGSLCAWNSQLGTVLFELKCDLPFFTVRKLQRGDSYIGLQNKTLALLVHNQLCKTYHFTEFLQHFEFVNDDLLVLSFKRQFVLWDVISWTIKKTIWSSHKTEVIRCMCVIEVGYPMLAFVTESTEYFLFLVHPTQKVQLRLLDLRTNQVVHTIAIPLFAQPSNLIFSKQQRLLYHVCKGLQVAVYDFNVPCINHISKPVQIIKCKDCHVSMNGELTWLDYNQTLHLVKSPGSWQNIGKLPNEQCGPFFVLHETCTLFSQGHWKGFCDCIMYTVE